MSSRKKLVSIIWLFAAAMSAVKCGATEIATYRYPGGIVSASFDPKIISKPALDKLMRLSPNMVQYNDLVVPIDIRRCLPKDPSYSDCGNMNLKISNVEENIRRISAIRKRLMAQNVPEDLRPVQTYLSEIQTFALWRANRTKDFLLTRDTTVLEAPYSGLDVARGCNVVLQKTNHALEIDRETLVVIDWSNCVWSLEMEKIGSYPRQHWDSFLSSHKIREVVKEESPD
jgi:hypothetical protein